MAGLDRSGTSRPDPYARTRARLTELKTRTNAAAKTADDMAIARQREQWRESKKRQRREIAEKKRLRTRTASRDVRVPESTVNEIDLFGPPRTPKPLKPKENATRAELEKLSRDRRAPASARVTALRTIAELDGHIGRLQSQAQDTSDAPLSTMTREQLENELVRLRAISAQSGT
jgi:hypothetical protein